MCGFQPRTRKNASKLGVETLLIPFSMGRKLWVEIWCSGKQRIKQHRITYIISIINYNDGWNNMAPKEQIMLCSWQKSEKEESLLPIKYMSRKGVSEGGSEDENLYIYRLVHTNLSVCKLYCITDFRVRKKNTDCLARKKIKDVTNLLLLLITISDN